MIQKIWNIISDFGDRLDKHNIYLLAAGISFNIVLYILPLFLVLLFILTNFFAYNDVMIVIEELVQTMMPKTTNTQAVMQTITTEVGLIFNKSSYLGYVGIFLSLWVSSTLISAFRSSLNKIYDLESPKFFLIYKLKDILLTVIFTVLILIYSYALPIVSIGNSLIKTISPDRIEWLVSGIMLSVYSMLAGTVLYYFIFSYVPNKKLPRRARYSSTIICVLLMEISRNIFSWYIGTIADYGKFYGTYAIIVSIFFWIYYSSLIILLSAEIGKMFNDLKEENI